jgi:hypothetical protein
MEAPYMETPQHNRNEVGRHDLLGNGIGVGDQAEDQNLTVTDADVTDPRRQRRPWAAGASEATWLR